jgi:DNA replicative helicase MCM subunit Mcm2 (Cdc46/Mcm family)
MHAQQDESSNSEISLDLMRKYVCYAKMKMRPTLSEEA